MNNPSSNTTGSTTSSMDKKKTAEQSATFGKKDAGAEGAHASKVDVSRSTASDNAPVKDETARQATDDAGKSQR